MSKENKDKICNRYKKRESMTSISKDYPFTRTVIKRILKEGGIFDPSRAKRLYNLNEDVFSGGLNKESAYWVGFLMADGSLYKHENRSITIQIGLSNKDRKHLTKFQKFLETNKPIYDVDSNKSSNLIVSSTKIANDLKRYGVVENKSLVASAKNIKNIKYERDFWRGVIDGDGSLNSVDRKLNLSGTEEICKQFNQFVKRSGIITRASVHPYANANCFYVNYSSNVASEVAELLYKDSKVFLERKYKIAKKYILLNKKSKVKTRKLFNVYNRLTRELVGTWSNQSQCARDLNIYSSGINLCLNGKQEYVDKYIFNYTG